MKELLIYHYSVIYTGESVIPSKHEVPGCKTSGYVGAPNLTEAANLVQAIANDLKDAKIAAFGSAIDNDNDQLVAKVADRDE